MLVGYTANVVNCVILELLYASASTAWSKFLFLITKHVFLLTNIMLHISMRPTCNQVLWLPMTKWFTLNNYVKFVPHHDVLRRYTSNIIWWLILWANSCDNLKYNVKFNLFLVTRPTRLVIYKWRNNWLFVSRLRRSISLFIFHNK